MEENKAKVIEQFSKNANSYVTSPSHAEGKDLSMIRDWLNPGRNWIVLDIATGGGHVAKTISPDVKQVFATDLTKKMLQNTANYLKNYENIYFVLADAENLPFLDDTFDAVTCRIAPHHFPRPDLFIKETSRVLKPGGKFLLIDNITPEDPELAKYMNGFEKLRDNSHVKCLSASKWEQLTQEHQLIKQKNNIHKKTFPFSNWVRRTTDKAEERKRVKDFILNGSSKALNYFRIEQKDGEITSLKVDEMMALFEKQHQ
ncbi:Methyltransferase domain-containing protein [Salinibacillus kushneri]|uniref:Methyltransferase domain-containing protein n=1 Tax=Salinibacillus kushneri TaxID=237682 RepID=A0A1I0E0R9_9BACI|nr:class I SAM-dependent methyltransferase [Salinibacillus kushneri]SET37749.1 Methyltransferase domain-containing protein [Salinibacillus kushneri]